MIHKEFNNLIKHLRQSKPNDIDTTNFEHTLRRALLNSDFFTPNIFARWQKRLGLNFKTMLWPAAGISFIIAGLVIFNPEPNIQNLTSNVNESTPALLTQAPSQQNTSPLIEPKEIFNNWYHNGRIQYKRQEENGSRVYTVKLDGGIELELMDPNPFTISLTSAP